MERGYSLSAEALLYSVVLKKKAGIFGVKNVLSGMDEGAYADFARKAEEELEACGAAELDFGEGISLTEEFDGLMDLCTDCAGVVAVDLRNEKDQKHMTFYLGSEQVPVLVTEGEGYRLYPSAQAMELLRGFLRLPEGRFNFADFRIESRNAAGTKEQDLAARGMDQEGAKFLAEVLNGGNSFCEVSRIEGFEKEEFLPFAYSDKGCAEVRVDYDADREYFVFRAVDGEELLGRIEQMLKEEMLTSFDENEHEGIEYLPEELERIERDQELEEEGE